MASFSPIFAFTTSCQLIIFHGHCTGNVQFKLLIAVMIIETTGIRIEESNGKIIDNSNNKKTHTNNRIRTTTILTKNRSKLPHC
jgi:predicted methyltransferase MtxX (methanogen marker protein 4)